MTAAEDTKTERKWTVLGGDCLEMLKTLPADSVDAIVTDPPAGIAFMGADWDKDKGGRAAWVSWMTDVARECFRVIKPGGHALVWAIPRTSHWTGWAWEDAGWEPRDKIVHLFGSGFPKSYNVSKSIDKAAGAEREVVGIDHEWIRRTGMSHGGNTYTTTTFGSASGPNAGKITVPATEAAKQWEGWGTALKPASEDWWLFRKPLIGTIVENVLEHGTGAINIDGCRIGTDGGTRRDGKADKPNEFGWENMRGHGIASLNSGRWPANVSFDEEAARLLDEQSGDRPSRIAVQRNGGGGLIYPDPSRPNLKKRGSTMSNVDWGYTDSGGASRFFYTAKASKSERGVGNVHPTVKPISLMRWLARLVTPPDGVVLDPFAGSGTTLLAAKAEGFSAIGIEREAEYVGIIKNRLDSATPEWIRELDYDESESKDETPASIDDLLGFNDE